jgi:hypothetical protein
MTKILTLDQVQILIEETQASFPHPECETCECYLGYLSQLQLDSVKETRQILAQLQPDRNELHSCLGCDPCPPGDHFAEYLRAKQTTAKSTLSCTCDQT